MKDRIPTKPNRYAVYDDAHNFLRYEYHERADEPTQVGSAINKANLLPDDVASALGLTGDPQVKDALNKIKTLIDTAQNTANGRAQIEIGSYAGNGTCGEANPNSLTFGFIPRVLILFYSSGYICGGSTGDGFNYLPAIGNPSVLKTVFTPGLFHSFINYKVIFAKRSEDFKTVFWYHENSASNQFNESDQIYDYVAIG